MQATPSLDSAPIIYQSSSNYLCLSFIARNCALHLIAAVYTIEYWVVPLPLVHFAKVMLNI